ncbi:MAG: HD domain-containing protein [Candidatus Pacearchaeota archaeon]|jgi:uncharacterized protein
MVKNFQEKMDEKFYEELREQIQDYFEKGGSHAFDHTQRVFNLALHLSKEKEIDLDILKASVLLHDIARKKQDELNGEICHAQEGAKIAKEILEKTDFPEDKIEKVVHAIEAHRQSRGPEPETEEAKILSDADKLDALGAITIGGIFSTGGKVDRPLYDPKIPPKEDYKNKGYSDTTINGFYEKLLKLKPENFYTEEAKKLAKGRYKFVEEFLERFLKEWDGEL